ncbi:redoxin domain-containing protein [Spirillospora sp. NPDC047418]
MPGRRATIEFYYGDTFRTDLFHAVGVTPVCNRHVQDLVRSRDEVAGAVVQVLVALPAAREEAVAWKIKRRLPFPVLVGREGTPHEMLGLSRKVFGSIHQSGSLLFDRQGVIRHSNVATMPTSGYDKTGIIAAVQALRD